MATRKTFKTTTTQEPKTSPAVSYMSTVEERKKAGRPTKHEDGPMGKRVQLLMMPELHARVTELVRARGTNLNALVADIIAEYIDSHEDEVKLHREYLERRKAVFGKGDE